MSKNRFPINLKDAAVDEHTLHSVGATVVAQWESLPKEAHTLILEALGNVDAISLRTPKKVKKKFKEILKFNDLEI